jgi:uncharacterized protein with ATP-grasp and redox domains
MKETENPDVKNNKKDIVKRIRERVQVTIVGGEVVDFGCKGNGGE